MLRPGGCGKTPIAAIGDHRGRSPLLILRVLRGAKAPLFHGTTGMQEFFRNLLDKLSLMTRPASGLMTMMTRCVRKVLLCSPIRLQTQQPADQKKEGDQEHAECSHKALPADGLDGAVQDLFPFDSKLERYHSAEHLV